MIISLFANVSSPKVTDPFPYQDNIDQNWRLLPNLCQPLQTHAMATHYGGIGKPLENDSDPRILMPMFGMITRQIQMTWKMNLIIRQD